jgi:hypothetical protein
MRIHVSFLLMLFCAQNCAAAIIRVPDEQPTIQAGIDAASRDDTILVAPGTYTGDGNRDVYIAKMVRLMSEAGPDSTIIDCEGSPTELHRAFMVEEPGAIVEGFTVTGGSRSKGSAAYFFHGYSRITDCVFTNNYGTSVRCDYSWYLGISDDVRRR